MKNDYKGIAEEDFMSNLLDWTIRTSLNLELSVNPTLFLSWGEYSHSSQPTRFKSFKKLLASGDNLEKYFGIKDKESFLNNLMTDSEKHRNVLLSAYKTHFLQKSLLYTTDLKGTDLNYNALIVMIANYSYYSEKEMTREEAFMVEQVRFTLLFELDVEELESYTKEILESPNLTEVQKKYIRKGLEKFKDTYNSADVKKVREFDKEGKTILKNLYKKNFT
ncbi:MAG: hypothetical protein AB9915_01770 [Candidatus Dojkabacteria bacterium]